MKWLFLVKPSGVHANSTQDTFDKHLRSYEAGSKGEPLALWRGSMGRNSKRLGVEPNGKSVTSCWCHLNAGQIVSTAFVAFFIRTLTVYYIPVFPLDVGNNRAPGITHGGAQQTAWYMTINKCVSWGWSRKRGINKKRTLLSLFCTLNYYRSCVIFLLS